jgi:hypothetical protein
MTCLRLLFALCLATVLRAQSGVPEGFEGVALVKEYQTEHNGVTHRIYRQSFSGLEVFNSTWVVNLDRSGNVLNSGGQLYPRPADDLYPPDLESAYGAARSAAVAVNAQAGERWLPVPKQSSRSNKSLAFERGAMGAEVDAQPGWYGWRGAVRPCWSFRIVDENGIDGYRVIVDAETRAILHKRIATYYQRPPQALVYTHGTPQPNPNPGTLPDGVPPFVDRVLVPLTGDRRASPEGWVRDQATAGNNTTTGRNLLGIPLLRTPVLTTAVDGDFRFPLELGPGAPSPLEFSDAVTTNLFYWVNRAHDLFYESGFDEPAGNFQDKNFDRGGVGGDAMLAFSHYGAAAAGQGQLANAFYTSFNFNGEDGDISGIHMFLSYPGSIAPLFYTDGSLDAGVIIHEYAHGVSERLARDLYTTFQGAAMGEALSDFFALEFLIPEGAPADGIYPMGGHFDQDFRRGIRTFPYTTDLAVNPITYARLGRVTSTPQIHNDGGIWFMAMWEMRANLIEQFGEKEGRRRTRLLVMDGMKLATPAASYVDMRDAILLADRVNFNGASQRALWRAFAKRGLGALAQSGEGDTIHVRASFEMPSAEGRIALFEERYMIGETVRVLLNDANLTGNTVQVRLTSTSGDIENVFLRKKGSLWIGTAFTSAVPGAQFNGVLSLMPGDFIEAHYVDYDTGSGAKLIQASVPVEPAHTSLFVTPPPEFRFQGESRLNLRATSNTSILNVLLPFEFPFFGEKYRYARVFAGGLIGFGPLSVPQCKDRNALAEIRGIAPLWTEMRTNGTTQSDEDVYVSTTANSITFRWRAETTPQQALVSPEPLNFAATLYDNGQIEFRYGDGNRNIPTAFATVCGAGPTVGISNGNQTFVQLAGLHHARVNLENAPLARLVPAILPSSLPQVRLDTAVEGQSFEGVMVLTGAAWDENAISRLDVLVDGVSVTRATTGLTRTDICGRESLPGCPGIGFSVALNLSGLGIAPGRHTLSLRATSRRGATTDHPVRPYSFEVRAGSGPQPVAAIARPASGEQVFGVVTIQGSVYMPSIAITAVDVMVGGITVGRATYNQPSAAACSGVTNAPNCPNAGFVLGWNSEFGFPPILNGKQPVSLRITDQSGRVTITPPISTIELINDPTWPITGVLETITNNQVLRGTVRVAGYAFVPSGRITSATVLVDGIAYISARIGLPRPDICAQLESAAGCPDIGFEATLDTTRFPNGEHTLGVRIGNSRGDTLVVPILTRNGINVVIRNP